MTWVFRTLTSFVLVGSVLLFACSPAPAQSYGWVQGTRYAPSPGYLGESYSSPYYTTFGFTLNGFRPRFYDSYATGTLPTYLTSINYPNIYGSYGYMFAPGRFTFSAQPADYTTAPTIYGVYAPETNALVATPALPNTAATPLQTTATINVVLPANAELTFQGVRMAQMGDYRRFATPPLVPGNNYTYDIQATWRENGQVVTRERRVPIQAGDQLTVDLLSPAPSSEGTSILRTQPGR